ncbi:hypothetical protein CERZMDRAFT_89004 [Cercospora zeae-maydis SCOH1-5]|uniref:Uncharacterized protein n=1 Tax=Cercospora zeae-maydis SCOH1-5 TaxID=717836 RepID=A0A6A6F081_9PEZI|nr:hypothetical protein CERZMDRAFT_89004 [Cercospora zeae-maydis SCOH1-5]
MHRPTILLLFTSFIYTATAVIHYSCGFDPNVINWNNCAVADKDYCNGNCKLQCRGTTSAYANAAVNSLHLVLRAPSGLRAYNPTSCRQRLLKISVVPRGVQSGSRRIRWTERSREIQRYALAEIRARPCCLPIQLLTTIANLLGEGNCQTRAVVAFSALDAATSSASGPELCPLLYKHMRRSHLHTAYCPG